MVEYLQNWMSHISDSFVDSYPEMYVNCSTQNFLGILQKKENISTK